MTFDLRRLRSAEYRSRLQQCIHCGLCLEACPTYVTLRTETDSPRGRIVLMRAAAEGQVDDAGLDGAVRQHIDLCLGCRACETACPSGVQYGALLHEVRVTLAGGRRLGRGERLARRLGLHQLLPHPERLRVLARFLRFYEVSGLQHLVRGAIGQRLLPAALQAAEAILPPIAAPGRRWRDPAPAWGPRRGRVAFFLGCIQDSLLSPANAATVRVLQRNGYEVVFPRGQTCCGAAHLHTGDEAGAAELARRNIDAFDGDEFEAIINNAGGCGATLKEEYPHLLAGDPRYAARARRFAGRVEDISEFLAGRLAAPQHPVPARAVYADSCHLRHVQKVVTQPRDLLRAVPGLTLVELKHPDRCCGSAGIYNIVHPDVAGPILDEKMVDIAATGADLIITSNTGCHLQLLAGVRRAGLNARVLHMAEVLDLAYGPWPEEGK